MYVLNRRGEREPVSFDQILHRVQSLCYGLHPLVDPARVSQAVINGMYAGIRTSELDELAAQTSGELLDHCASALQQRWTTAAGVDHCSSSGAARGCGPPRSNCASLQAPTAPLLLGFLWL